MGKINLKGISKILSEKELKNVMGGSNGSGGGDHCLKSCTYPDGNKTYQVPCEQDCSTKQEFFCA